MRIGLQMYSVRDYMARSPIDTTRSVLAMGYRNLEFANLSGGDPGIGFDVDPGELRDIINAEGGQVISVHIWPLTERNLADVIAFHRDLGTKFIVSKFLPRTLEEALDSVPNLIRVGEQLQRAGIGHLLHNGVLRTRDGRKDLELVLDRVPTELLGVELDTYWVLRSGLDPIEAIKRFGERIEILHQKDLPASISQPVDIDNAFPADQPMTIESPYADPRYVAADNFVELGEGRMPLQEIIDAAAAYTRSSYMFVEQDFTALDQLDSVRRSLTALRSCTGVAA
jgi:sugar phosphate isomerase/epimerase